jgi:hypothetical protein
MFPMQQCSVVFQRGKDLRALSVSGEALEQGPNAVAVTRGPEVPSPSMFFTLINWEISRRHKIPASPCRAEAHHQRLCNGIHLLLLCQVTTNLLIAQNILIQSMK